MCSRVEKKKKSAKSTETGAAPANQLIGSSAGACAVTFYRRLQPIRPEVAQITMNPK